MKNVRQKAAKGVAWQVSGAAIRGGLQLVVVAILARSLSPEDFGLFALATIVLALADILTNYSGFTQAVIQRHEVVDSHISAANYLVLAFGLLAMALLYWLAPVFAILLRNSDAIEVIQALSPLPLLTSFGAIALGQAFRTLNVKVVTIINVLAYGIGYGAVSISLALKGLGVFALVFGALSEAAIRAIALNIMIPANRFTKVRMLDIVDIARYGFGAMLTQLINACVRNADRLIVQYVFGTSVLGLYHIARQLVDIPNRFVGTALQRVMFATLARVRTDNRKQREVFDAVTEALYLVYVPGTAVLIALSGEIVNFLLGQGWEQSAVVFAVLAVALPIQSVNGIASASIRANGAVYTASVIRFLMLVYLVVAGTICARFGIAYVGLAVASGAVVYFALSTYVMISKGLIELRAVAIRLASAYISLAVLCVLSLGLKTLAVSYGLSELGQILAVGTSIFLISSLAVIVARHKLISLRHALSLVQAGRRPRNA